MGANITQSFVVEIALRFDHFKLEDVQLVEKVGLLNLSAACVTK